MNKRCVVATMLGLCCALTFAGGRKDIETKELGPVNSWDESFDINTKKNGKWNILVQAEDKAGNQTVSGPYNIWLDPKSDLPIVRINNPAPSLRVPGSLNIVGTCSDDDAVDHVSIILDGDDSNIIIADGTEFWGYFLDTTSLAEGTHTIEVWGTDINGLNGNHETVSWQLDRRAPLTQVQNVAMGTLVSGKVTLKGTVTDGNGIDWLQFSTDNGDTFYDAKLKETKLKEPAQDGSTSIWSFEIPIDTRQQPDGAATCWFRAKDKTGTMGTFSFLYFVDNTGPDVRIVWPPKGQGANGVFTVAGYAKDTIGVETLTWQWGSEKGQFEVIPGNPYFVKEINSIGQSGTKDFTVTATDTAGNTVTVRQSIKLDQDADKPVVSIQSPANGGAVDGSDGTFFIRGIATDDDGVVSVTWRLDGGEEHVLQCDGVFYAAVPGDLPYGKHTVQAWATDRYGVRGNAVSSTFEAKGAPPSFGDATVGSAQFTDAMPLNPDSGDQYALEVCSSSGLSAVEYALSWGTDGTKVVSAPLKGGEKTYTLRVPLDDPEIPWGGGTTFCTRH